MDNPPSDPADHAEEFAHRYAEALDVLAGQTFLDLKLDDAQMGARPRPRSGTSQLFP